MPEEVLTALAPGRTIVGVLTIGGALLLAAAVAGCFALFRRDARLASALLLWIFTPLAFFTLVPAGQTNFFPRYVIPALPFWLILAAVGCFALGAFLRHPAVVGGLLVIAFLAWESRSDYRRLDRLHAFGLPDVTRSVERIQAGVLFSSTGSDDGLYPPELLDDLVALEVHGLRRVEEFPAVNPRSAPENVEELGRERVLAFLSMPQRPGTGIWIFRGSVQDLERRLAGSTELEVERVSPTLLLVRSASPREPRDLVEQAVAVREAWVTSASNEGGFGQTILEIDRRALAALAP